MPFNFINMETSDDSGKTLNDEEVGDAGDVEADGEEIPQDSAPSPLELEDEELSEEDSEIMTGNATSLIPVSQ